MNGSKGGLLRRLEGIFKFTGEYLSHQTALFFLGFSRSFPSVFTIVSPQRRFERSMFGHAVKFIYHPKAFDDCIQTITIGNVDLPVSTLELTLVDRLRDQGHAPHLRKLANLFAVLPYNSDTVAALGKIVSDAVVIMTGYFLPAQNPIGKKRRGKMLFWAQSSIITQILHFLIMQRL